MNLRIINNVDTELKQDCYKCPHIDKCWKTSTNNIIINLLVCRIQINKEKNKSTKLLLKMFRPQLQKMATQISNDRLGSYISSTDLIHEMESVIIEHIISHYIIGEIAYFTYYLFGFPNGVMRKWMLWKTNQDRKVYNNHYLVDEPISIEDDTPILLEENQKNERIEHAKRVIDDGITLRASEYRVMKFCLENARDNRNTRMIDGLHLYLANQMNISRTRVTQHFRNAKKKLTGVC